MIVHGGLSSSLGPGLAAVHAAAFAGRGRAWSADEITALANAPSRIVVLDDGATPSGFVILRLAADEVEVLTVAVDPRVWGQGIGAAVLCAALDAARAAGARQAFLEVGAENHRAQRLYARLGFTTVGRRPGYYAGSPPEDALLMARSLGDAP